MNNPHGSPSETATASPTARPAGLPSLAGIATWALILVLGGVATSVFAVVAMIRGAPDWFFTVFTTTGIIGMLLTMMAFATARFRGIPWLFLIASTITLLVAFMLISLT
ncbi:hypothetical protein [Haloglycomyces albus]|uniref:hypothetical protein n=1 Tax=Haloglycomyces albus TaxID=526067 RepID=UPI00046D6AC1|nr:hypothetical protein [Haloglycomyces albus]